MAIGLPRFAVRRPVMTTVLFAVIILFGMVSLRYLPLDLFPEIEPPAISVMTIYRGAGALEVEEKVTKPIENVLASVGNLKDIRSVTQEGLSNVTCIFEFDTNLDVAANEMRDKLEFAKRHLPDDIDQPVIVKFNLAMFPVMFFAVTAQQEDVRELNEEIEHSIAEPLQRVPGVASVAIFNSKIKQVIVALEHDRLKALNLSLSAVMGAIQGDNLSLPAGHIEIGAFDYTLRVPGEYSDIEQIRETIIAKTPDGLVRVQDVGRVFWGAEDIRQFATLRNQDVVFLMVQKQSGVNTVQVARDVREKLDAMRGRLPHGLDPRVVLDTSIFITNMVRSLSQAVYVGGFFVILVVLFFLRRLRTSAIIALSIPTSLIIAFAFLYSFDYTLNVISLMALSLAIGMVVDNSIVVIDNITRHLEMGKSRARAAVDGANEVGSAILASTLTTVMIFAPLFFVGGFIGIMFKQLAGVVILTLSASLLAALLLTPMLCSKVLKPSLHVSGEEGAPRGRGFYAFSERVLLRVESAYAAVLDRVVSHKLITGGLALSAFVLSLFILPIIGVDFMPKQDSGDIQINFELPLGTRVDTTYEVAREIMDIALADTPEIENVYMRGGESGGGMSGRIEGTNTGMVGIKLSRLNERDRSVLDIVAVIRPKIERIPSIEKLDIQAENPLSSILTGGEKPVTVQVISNNIEKAEDATAKLLARMREVKGLTDITTDLVNLKPELQVTIDRVRANQVGLNVAMVAGAVRSAFHGAQAGLFRQEGDEYDIVVKLQKTDRDDMEKLLNLDLTTMTGQSVKLKNVAKLIEGMTPLSIQHLNKERMLTIGARTSGVPLGTIAQEISAIIEELDFPPEIGIEYGGELKQQAETQSDLLLVLLLGILLVYLVMAAQFESYLDPFVIMFSVPFGIMGVFGGLLITGFPLSLPAFLGMIILVGIVVNNAIVLVDYINQLRREHGMSLGEAIRVGGQRRLRPVLMTAFTTIFGMLPLAVFTGEGHEMWQPMGIAVVFGLFVSTMVTLLLIPVLYAATERFRRLVALDAEEAPDAE